MVHRSCLHWIGQRWIERLCIEQRWIGRFWIGRRWMVELACLGWVLGGGACGVDDARGAVADAAVKSAGCTNAPRRKEQKAAEAWRFVYPELFFAGDTPIRARRPFRPTVNGACQIWRKDAEEAPKVVAAAVRAAMRRVEDQLAAGYALSASLRSESAAKVVVKPLPLGVAETVAGPAPTAVPDDAGPAPPTILLLIDRVRRAPDRYAVNLRTDPGRPEMYAADASALYRAQSIDERKSLGDCWKFAATTPMRAADAALVEELRAWITRHKPVR